MRVFATVSHELPECYDTAFSAAPPPFVIHAPPSYRITFELLLQGCTRNGSCYYIILLYLNHVYSTCAVHSENTARNLNKLSKAVLRSLSQTKHNAIYEYVTEKTNQT